VVMPRGFRHLCCSPYRPAIEIHEVPLWCSMREYDAPVAPVTGGMRPSAWCRIAHAELLRHGQGNAALLQIGVAAAPRQGSLERGELQGKVGLCWSRPTRRWRVSRGPAHSHRGALQRGSLSACWRPCQGRLPLLFRTPLRPCRVHIGVYATFVQKLSLTYYTHNHALLSRSALLAVLQTVPHPPTTDYADISSSMQNL
jgi:hypothetical protein